ncbi:MAG TPA: hypothetical protein VLU25_15035 [Acidobacteriota bacterium]|nr:hypothetical protein [Acidobacteriota bacterium]
MRTLQSGVGWKAAAAAALLFFISTWVHFPPPDPQAVEGWPLLDIGPVALGPPWVLSGDSPHYLLMARSLAEDGDLDLADDYQSARRGGGQAGHLLRGRALDPHAERDDRGRLLPTHAPALSLVLALLSWPLAFSLWFEPWCIWLNMCAALACLAWMAKRLPQAAPDVGGWRTHPVMLLAFATPFWCYSRDLWTEPWTALAWLGLLFLKHPAALLAAGLAGTLIKYPFALVPAAMGAWALWRGRRSRATALLASSALGLAAGVGLTQWIYRDFSDHFSLFHSGIHARFDWPFEGMAGLLLSPESGLLFFFPILLWPLAGLLGGNHASRPQSSASRREAIWGLAAFFLVHAAYEDWGGGTGFSARYLVPALPLLLLYGRERLAFPRLYLATLLYSVFWAVVGGMAPALVYERSPWGVLIHIVDSLT